MHTKIDPFWQLSIHIKYNANNIKVLHKCSKLNVIGEEKNSSMQCDAKEYFFYVNNIDKTLRHVVAIS